MRETPLTYRQLQIEHGPWALHNFGERAPWQPGLGAIEEIGELCHAYLKAAQGIRGTIEEHEAAMKDAVADFLIFVADWMRGYGFECLNETFTEIADYCSTEGSKRPCGISIPSVPDRRLIMRAAMYAAQADDMAEASLNTLSRNLAGPMRDEARGEMLAAVDLVVMFTVERGWDLQAIVEETWDRVRQRDFRKDSRTGGEAVQG